MFWHTFVTFIHAIFCWKITRFHDSSQWLAPPVICRVAVAALRANDESMRGFVAMRILVYIYIYTHLHTSWGGCTKSKSPMLWDSLVVFLRCLWSIWKNETRDKTKHSQPIIKQWSSGGFLLGKLPGGQPGKWNIPRFSIIAVPHTWWFASWPNLIPYSWRSLRSKGRVKETLRYQSHKQRVPNTTATLWKSMWLKHFGSMFVNLRSFKVENNTSILENHDTLPMFGTILRQKIAMLLHQSQSTRCTKYYKKETTYLYLRTTSFQSPGGEDLPNWIFS